MERAYIGTRQPKAGDLLEFFDGEGFVSGTFMEREFRDDEEWLALRVGNDTQWVHHTDVVAVLKKSENRESDIPLLSERFRTDIE
jgi:hypothetical protein